LREINWPYFFCTEHCPCGLLLTMVKQYLGMTMRDDFFSDIVQNL